MTWASCFSLAGVQAVAAFTMSSNAASTLALTSSLEIMRRGCGTVTKHMSVRPWLFWVPRERVRKGSVTMVTVGMPDFSRLDWSTTSHEVQLPQSACEAMTMSGLTLATAFTIRMDSSCVAEILFRF